MKKCVKTKSKFKIVTLLILILESENLFTFNIKASRVTR